MCKSRRVEKDMETKIELNLILSELVMKNWT